MVHSRVRIHSLPTQPRARAHTHACAHWHGQVDRLIFCRPAKPLGGEIGFLPGDIASKISCYMRPMLECVDTLWGKGAAQQLMDEVSACILYHICTYSRLQQESKWQHFAKPVCTNFSTAGPIKLYPAVQFDWTGSTKLCTECFAKCSHRRFLLQSTVRPTPYTLHPTPYTLVDEVSDCILYHICTYAMYCICAYTLHPTPYTLNRTDTGDSFHLDRVPQTLHPTP